MEEVEDKLPLLPLRGMLVFPGMIINLDVGRDRSLRAVNAAMRTVSLRPVQRGQATTEKIVVASGLKAGEQVITEGADQLKDGARVVLAGDAPTGPRGGASHARAGGKQPRASSAGHANGASPAAPALPGSAPASSAQRRSRNSQASGS